MKPGLNKYDLENAAHAWKVGGCQALGLWFTHHRQACAGDYGALVANVRRYLGDDTDYSAAAGCDYQATIGAMR